MPGQAHFGVSLWLVDMIASRIAADVTDEAKVKAAWRSSENQNGPLSVRERIPVGMCEGRQQEYC